MLQVIEPVTDFLPNRIRSFVNISKATVADSGALLWDTILWGFLMMCIEKKVCVCFLCRCVRMHGAGEHERSNCHGKHHSDSFG